ncbi:MAG: hypothetical protein U0797_25555 [Gemmataceae bacterium]
MSDAPIILTFDAGTLVLSGGADGTLSGLPGVKFDPRTGSHRAEGRASGHRRAPTQRQDCLQG